MSSNHGVPISPTRSLLEILNVTPLVFTFPHTTPAPKRLTHGIKQTIHPRLLNFINRLHQLPKPPGRESTLRKPLKIFRRQIKKRHTAWREKLRTIPPKRHTRVRNLRKNLPKTFALNLRKSHTKSITSHHTPHKPHTTPVKNAPYDQNSSGDFLLWSAEN